MSRRPTVKPHYWPASRDRVMKKWQWVWDGMVFGQAFWECGKESVSGASNADVNLIHRSLVGSKARHGLSGPGGQHQMHYNRAGIGYEHLNNSGNGVLLFPHVNGPYQRFVKNITVVFYGSFPTAVDTTNVGLMAFQDQGGVGLHTFLLWWHNSGVQFRAITAAGDSQVEAAHTVVGGAGTADALEPACFIGTYDGETTRIYVNGLEDATPTSTSSTLTTGIGDIRVFEYQNNTETGGLANLALVYNRTWTPAQVAMFQQDQFGFLRRERAIVRVAAAAGNAMPMAMHSYRQRRAA